MTVFDNPVDISILRTQALDGWGLLDCSHYFKSGSIYRPILNNTSFLLAPLSRNGILVPQGAGKSTLVRLLCGIELPSVGYFLGLRGDAVLLNYVGHLHPAMSGEENVRNIANLVGLDPNETALLCEALAMIGDLFRQPVKNYPATAKAILAYVLNLQLPAKFLLAEDRIIVGDTATRQRCMQALAQSLKKKGLIFITSNPRVTKHVCEHHYVLVDGKLIACSDHRQAVAFFKTNHDNQIKLAPELSYPDGEINNEQF